MKTEEIIAIKRFEDIDVWKPLEQAVNRREEQNNGFKNRNILLLETKAFYRRGRRGNQKRKLSVLSFQ